jgi:hypothetical protein
MVLNRFVKEFHKRKERVYREKVDKIQREKINLLKNNDVEGYLRMVQVSKDSMLLMHFLICLSASKVALEVCIY